MAKQIKNVLKLNLPAGTATPAPPVGPILGQAGINMMQFLKEYNEKTQDKRGQVIPAEITIYKDNSFTFVLKLPPVSDLIKQAIKLKAGSGKAGTETVGTLPMDKARKIAEQKLPDLNCSTIEAALQMVIGSARSMGVEVK
jgi:large subunit ribosomal protein L11